MNAFRRDRWSASSGGTHSLLGGQFAVYLRLISPYLSPVYRAASISYQRHINFMLTAARINTLFTTGLRPEAVACGPPAGGGCRDSKPPLQVGEAFTSRRTRPAGREPCGSSAYKFPPAHRRPGHSPLPPGAAWAAGKSIQTQFGAVWLYKWGGCGTIKAKN